MATFETYAALGTAHAFGMDKWIILICVLAGGIAGVFVAAFLGKRIQQFINKTFRKKKVPEKKNRLHLPDLV
jgi:membrane protein DedA with SNARE-associated domain